MIYVRWLVSHLALPPLRMQFTGDNPLLRETLLLQQSDQQSPGSLGVATELHDLVENISILINGSPKPVLLAGDGNHHLVQVPDVLA